MELSSCVTVWSQYGRLPQHSQLPQCSELVPLYHFDRLSTTASVVVAAWYFVRKYVIQRLCMKWYFHIEYFLFNCKYCTVRFKPFIMTAHTDCDTGSLVLKLKDTPELISRNQSAQAKKEHELYCVIYLALRQ